MAKRRVSSLLPAVNQTDVLVKFFGATADQLFQPGTSEQISGYVGQYPTYYDPTYDFYVNEPDSERRVYQLEPAMISTDDTGTLTEALTYPDLLAYLDTAGGNTTNEPRLFETDYYAWAPPIDIDKLLNYHQYYWFGNDGDAAELPTLVITSPMLRATGDGATMSFAVPSSVPGMSSGQETPAAYVNGIKVSATLSGTSMVLSSAPAAGTTVVTTRLDTLAPAIIGQTTFPLTGMVNTIVSYFGDDYSYSFPAGTLNGSLPQNTSQVIAFVNGERVNFSYDPATGNATLIGTVPSSGTEDIDPDLVEIVTLNGIYILSGYTDLNSITSAAANAVPALSSNMRVRLVDTQGVYASTSNNAVYFVDGVGTSIRLTPDATMVRELAAQYVTIDRSSVNANAWSIRNNWVHQDTYAWSLKTFPANKAIRPIIEFVRDIAIWNYGVSRVAPVEACISTVNATLSDGNAISIASIAGTPIGTVYADRGVQLTNGMRLLVAQAATETPSLNNTIFTVGVNSSTGQNLITLTPTTIAANSTVLIAAASGFGDAGTEVYFLNGSWVLSQQWNESVDPLFALYDVEPASVALNDSSRYPGSNFSGNRIFGYATGTGTNDTILLRPLKYDNNGYIVFQCDAVTNRYTYSAGNISGLYCFATNNGTTSVVSSLWYPVAGQTTQPYAVSGVFRAIPTNLQANPMSEDVTYISRSDWTEHFAALVKNQTGFTGSIYAGNNYRDTARNPALGTQILQHRAPMLRAMLLAAEPTFDYGVAVRYADQEYTRFRNRFVRALVDLRNRGTVLDGTAASVWVQSALTALKRDKSINFPFSLSSMGGDHYFIPPTPAFFGVLPAVTPATIVDTTFPTPVTMLRGHDGSLTPIFGDWRDPIMLALETLIFSSINASLVGEARLEFDLASWFNGRFYTGTSGFSFEEVQAMLAPMFERWATQNRVDYRTNGSYDPSNPFTFNYRNVLDTAGNPLPGNWRAIYRFYFDTDRPHIAPWEMLGFAEQPSWWAGQYGTNYSITNTALWADLQTGTIRGGPRAGIDPRYARPGLSNFIPVNAAGQLLDPITAHIVTGQIILQTASRPWALGDGAPAEALWRNSPSYRFALAQIAFLMKPNRVAEILWDTLNTGYIGDQWVDLRTYQRPSPSNGYLVHGEIDPATGLQVEVIGIQQWLVDQLFFAGMPASRLGIANRNLNVRLLHRMAGFISSDDMSASADNFGLLPSENLSVMLYTSPTVRDDVYSGVIIEWTGSGFRVIGYDARDPFFRLTPPNTSGPKGVISLADTVEPPTPVWRPNMYYTISTSVLYQSAVYTCTKSHTSGPTFEIAFWNLSGAAPPVAPRVVTYRFGLTGIEEHVPYGTEFANIQQVADFLLAYERYLVGRGWVFDTLDPATNVTRDWSLAVREFLGWTQVQWSPGNFIALSPGAARLKYTSSTGNVLNVEDSSTGFFGLTDRSGQPIPARSARISRIDGDVTFTAIDADIFGTRVRVVEIEHALVFSNTTVFNDIVYAPLFNLRQARMRLEGFRTREWAGRLDAPGFVVAGDKLLPNFDKNVEDVRLMFEIEKTDRADLRDFARHQIGYAARDYMENLLLSETEQFEFYQGQIQAKGSPGVFDRLLRSQRVNADSNIVFLEEWAIRLPLFGAPVEPRVTLLLQQSNIKRDPQIIRFANTNNVPENWLSAPVSSSLWLDPPQQSAFFPTHPSPTLKVPTAGYVRLSEVQYTAFTPTDVISYFVTANNAGQTPYLAGERIWIYNVFGDLWSVWRVFELGSVPNPVAQIVTSTEDSTLTNMRIFMSLPHGLLASDIGCSVVIDASSFSTPDVVGVWTLTNFNTGANWLEINVQGSAGINFASTTSPPPHIRIMRSMRFRTSASAVGSGYPYAQGDLVYIDNDISTPGRWSVCEYINGVFTFTRNQPDRVDPNVITESMIYATGTQIIDQQIVSNQPLIDDLVVIDPLLGELAGEASREIEYIRDYDPANYNTGTAVTGPDVWGELQVGQVWWDTSTVRYLDPYTDILGASDARDVTELEYRSQNWAQIAPNTSVDVYEWVQSDVPPASYTTLSASDTTGTYAGTVYQADDPSWATRSIFDPSKAAEVTAYFFWVKGRDSTPDLPFRHTNCVTIAQGLISPTSLALPWVAPIAPDTVLVSGVLQALNEINSVLKIERHTDRVDHGHAEWLLIRSNDEQSLPPNWLWRKMRDGLSGFDDNLATLPYPSLHPTRATGVDPGQSIFLTANTLSARGGLLDARQSFVGIVNDILARTPLVSLNAYGVASLNLTQSLDRYLTRVSTTSDIESPIPALYDIRVYSAHQRNRLLASPRFLAAVSSLTSINVLIDGTAHKVPEWSIWTFNPAKAQNIITKYSDLIPNTGDLLISHADDIFDLATAFDYVVPHLSDRNNLLATDYYARNIVMNGVTTSYTSANTPTNHFSSPVARDNVEHSRPFDELVQIDVPGTDIWYWTAYDTTFGWTLVAHSKPILTGTRVYVESDESEDGFWSVYTYDPTNGAADSAGFVLTAQQDYRTSDFFAGTISDASPLPVVDWYAENITINDVVVSFSADKPPMVSYATTAARDATEGTSPNNLFVQIKDPTTGAWFWTAFDATTGWQTVALQGGTIALSTEFYDPARVLHNVGDVPNGNVMARDGSWELRVLFNAIVTGTILTTAQMNEMFFSMVHFIHAQQDDIDWIFKTSFMSVAGYAEPLLQTAIQTADVSDSLIAYIEEVKPYHVKIRDYSQQYSAGTDVANVHVTDFDKPVYFDPFLRSYRILDPTVPADILILQATLPWSEWYGVYQSPISPVRRIKTRIAFDRVSKDAEDAFDTTAYDPSFGFDGIDEDASSLAAGRIASSYTSIDPITGKDINAILTYSYGAADLLNTRFRGHTDDGGSMGYDVQVSVQTPASTIDGGGLSGGTAITSLINAPTSDANRAVSDTRTLTLPNGSTVTMPLGGVADPMGYGLRDPYAEANHPEERVPLLADDGLVMTVIAKASAGAPPQKTRVFDTSASTEATGTFLFDEIAESTDAVMVWLDGVRGVAGTDYMLDVLNRSVTVNLATGSSRVNKVVIHAFSFGGTTPIVERHLLAGNGSSTYTLNAPATTSQIEVVINGVRVDPTTLTVAGATLTLPVAPAASDDVVIVVYEGGLQTACQVMTQILPYNQQGEWTLANADQESLPVSAGTIVEVDGIRLRPPLTYYGAFTTAIRSISTDYTPDNNTVLEIYVNGVLYAQPVPLVEAGSSGYPFGAVALANNTIVPNSAGMLAFLGNDLVSLDPNFDAADVIVVMHAENEFDVQNGTLTITSPITPSSRIAVTTFTNAGLMGIKTHTFKANVAGEYPMMEPISSDYALVALDGKLIAPGDDYGFGAGSGVIDPSYYSTDAWVIATTFTGRPARSDISWRAATKTPAAMRMLPIVDDGGFDMNPFELQGFGEANDWLLGIPYYNAKFDVYGNVQGVPVYQMHDGWEYAEQSATITGTLNAALGPNDQSFSLTLTEPPLNPKLWPENPLTIPDPAANKPGVVWVAGERIEYWNLVRSGLDVTLSVLKRGTRGTAVSTEARALVRVMTDGITQAFYLDGFGGEIEVKLNGRPVSVYTAANAATANQGYTVTSTNPSGTVIEFNTIPAAGQYLTLAMTTGTSQPAGTPVVDASRFFQPEVPVGAPDITREPLRTLTTVI